MTESPTPIPDFVRVVLDDDPKYMTVWFHWALPGTELDRPYTQGICMLPRHVPRVARAFLEGALFDGPMHDRAGGPQVARDIDGRTYANATCRVWGKRLNADLNRLGY